MDNTFDRFTGVITQTFLVFSQQSACVIMPQSDRKYSLLLNCDVVIGLLHATKQSGLTSKRETTV